MGTHLTREAEVEREALFAQLLGAFMRRDYRPIERAMRRNVRLELPGSSPLAGIHRGYEAVRRYIVDTRAVLRASGKPVTFVHDEDQMLVINEVLVSGPQHEVEMMLRLRLRFDRSGKITTVLVEPTDLGLFDHVLRTAFEGSEALA
jgi:ketosteroid isomerase-like protein